MPKATLVAPDSKPAGVDDDFMNSPDPFLLEALRKARVRCADISTASGDVGALAQVMDVLLFAEEMSAKERSELLSITRDIPARTTQLELRVDAFETGTIRDLREEIADALKRINVLETERTVKEAVKTTEKEAAARWIGVLKIALVITWTAILTGGTLFAFFYKAVPRELPDPAIPTTTSHVP